MKKLCNTASSSRHGQNTETTFSKNRRAYKQTLVFYSFCVLFTLVLSGCMKDDLKQTESDILSKAHSKASPEIESLYSKGKTSKSPDLSLTTWLELQRVRSATAKYHNFFKAVDDGYVDINVVMPNMGYHFMKLNLVDANFEISKPEILVYNKTQNGRMQLVAVEYAVPLNLSASAPSGFTGDNDVWDRNMGFGLWLLHAWIWAYNPNGVFKSTNPLVHVD
jgi:hypothetical protein